MSAKVPRNLIENGWLAFKSRWFEQDRPEMQFDEVRIAFFFGVIFMVDLLHNTLEREKKGQVSPDHGPKVLNSVEAEIDDFLNETLFDVLRGEIVKGTH